MNEKIETLISKLDPDAYCTYKGYLYHASDPAILNHSEPEPLYGKLELERFAHLIIRECCIKMQDTDSFYVAWISESSYVEWASKVIKEHFGVE